MSINREDSYIFSSSLMRAGEKTLLPEDRIIKAAEAGNFREACAVIEEYGYGGEKNGIEPENFEDILGERERESIREVLSALPDSGELGFLMRPADYHNAKVILKSSFLGRDPDKYLTARGSIEPEKMKAMIRERDLAFLPGELAAAIDEASEVFGKGRDPQEIDLILDRACYKQMLREAEESGSDFLLGYVRLLIDTINICSFVRLRQIQKPWSFFRKVFIDGGNIKEEVFISSYEEPYKQAADKMQPYGFDGVMREGAVRAEETGLYDLLEKLCDNKRIEYIRQAKFVSFGVEPAAAFIIARESEIKNLRVILSGKKTGTPDEVILERLRKTYV